jgi:DNA-binding transcriptional regulator YdaS (Cro superfamily)
LEEFETVFGFQLALVSLVSVRDQNVTQTVETVEKAEGVQVIEIANVHEGFLHTAENKWNS